MNFDRRLEIVNRMHEHEVELATVKGKAYAGEEDTLSNFKDVSNRAGTTKYQVWLVYISKHLMAVENAIQENPDKPTEAAEGLLSRINDARVYLSLLACLLEEDGLLK